jgi:hypothetical protein
MYIKVPKRVKKILMVLLFGVISSVAFSSGSPSVQAVVTYPAQVLDLTNWKVTLPTGKTEKPTEFLQPALETCNVDPYFHANATADAVVFRAPVNGVTTSSSGYPRSELREMKNGGADNANWSTTSGTHTMFIDGAITAVPKTKKHIVFGQIHDSNDDVIVVRLEYPKLFVDINGKTGPTLDANYTLGKRFNVKFVAENGQIKIYYNGGQAPAYTMSKSASGCYFKAGAYTQSNCSKESDCSNGNFGEVIVHKLVLNDKVVIPVPAPAPVPEQTPAPTPVPVIAVPEPTPTPTPTPTSTPVGGLVFEAEAGVITSPMQIVSSVSASGEKYIVQTADLGTGSAKYTINVPSTGRYQLRVRAISPNGSSNSFYYQLDSGLLKAWSLPDETNTWTWIDGAMIDLAQGEHSLEIKKREKNTQLDAFELKLITPASQVVTTDGAAFFEAESGVISGGMRVLDDPTASGGKYIKADSSGLVNYQFNIPVTGTYRLAGWIQAFNGSSDSFSFSIDGKSAVTWTLAYPRLAWTYDVDDGHTYTLSAGIHTLSLKYREAGAKIDRVVLVKQ